MTDEYLDEVDELRRQLRTAQRALAREKMRTDELSELVINHSRSAVAERWSPKRVPAPPRDRRRRPEEAALWVLADWQGAKKTASYNSEVMRARVLAYTKHAAAETELRRSSRKIEHCTISFGGDMVEGFWNFAAQPSEIDQGLFGQFVTVSRLLVDVVAAALSTYRTVAVVSEWGNHGRLGNRNDGVPRPDNLDRMCYELARQLLADEPRLDWQDCPADIQRLEIGNYRALVLHGDELGRASAASPAIVQWANRQRSGAYPWDFRDVYIHHWHTHYELAMANGQGTVYGTGSPESDNTYASVGLAVTGVPSQRLSFVDPAAGRVVATSKVYLDAA